MGKRKIQNTICDVTEIFHRKTKTLILRMTGYFGRPFNPNTFRPKMKMKGPKFNPNYFTYPKPVEGTIIGILMVLFYLSYLKPDSFLLDYYGPLGTLGRYLNKHHMGLLQVILLGAIATHLGESVYAGILCRRKRLNTLPTVLWMLQTFVMGFPSLLQLVAYKPDLKAV